MFKRLLVPLDGSENSERAVPWAKLYATKEKAEVYLLRIPRTSHPVEIEEATRYLRGWEREFNYAGVPAKVLVRAGPAAAAIVRAARLKDCDAIVMATRGGSTIQRWLMGGITEQVMRLSPLPVLIVRSGMPLPKQARVRRIMVPVDGSGLAYDALGPAAMLARLHRASLEFVHVLPGARAGDRNYEAVRDRMMSRCAQLRSGDIRAVLRIERGDAASELLRCARYNGLIVMTTHGYGGYKRWLFGSVAEKVIREAPVPVYIHKSEVRMRAAGAG